MFGTVYHTGYFTDDVARAVAFYEQQFGGKLLKQQLKLVALGHELLHLTVHGGNPIDRKVLRVAGNGLAGRRLERGQVQHQNAPHHEKGVQPHLYAGPTPQRNGPTKNVAHRLQCACKGPVETAALP